MVVVPTRTCPEFLSMLGKLGIPILTQKNQRTEKSTFWQTGRIGSIFQKYLLYIYIFYFYIKKSCDIIFRADYLKGDHVANLTNNSNFFKGVIKNKAVQ